MNLGRHSPVAIVLAMGLVVPVASAQKPPSPPAPPSKPTQPATGGPLSSQPTQPGIQDDLVIYVRGRIATNDGSSLPNDVLVERVCNAGVRQQVYAAPQGDFSMQMGLRFDSFVDASGDPTSLDGAAAKRASTGGIPRRDLANCELRASAAGFRSTSISLIDLTPSIGTIDVGSIVMRRVAKVKGATLSAIPYKAPPNALRAYEKGVEAEKNGKADEARTYFQQALEIYPNYVSAWFQLGAVFEKQNLKDSARAAYTRATAIDTRFVPPYLSLAAMAFEAQNWTGVLQFTRHVIDLDLLNHGDLTADLLDLDESGPAQAYFYNAVANFKLDKIEEAEKSALKAEHVDLRTRFPQLHLLLGEIFVRKKNYAAAIPELQAYLLLDPHPKNEEVVREQLAKLEKLGGSAPSGDKPFQN